MRRHGNAAKFTMGLLGFVLTLAVGSIFQGYVLSKMWLWFVVPLGVVELPVAHAIGISLTAGLLTHQHDTSLDEDEERLPFGDRLAVRIIAENMLTAMVWGAGAVVHLFM